MVEQQQRSGAKAPDRKAATAPFKHEDEPVLCPYIAFSKDGQRFRIECEMEGQFVVGENGKDGMYIPELCAFCLQSKAVIGATFDKTGRDPIWERVHPLSGA